MQLVLGGHILPGENRSLGPGKFSLFEAAVFMPHVGNTMSGLTQQVL